MIKKEEGLYTLEGALAITIFTSLFMILLSLISIIRVETVVQSAINQTAMQLSQYSYAVISVNDALEGAGVSLDNFINEKEDTDGIEEDEISAGIYSILKATQRETISYTAGSILCKSITKGNFSVSNCDEWLEAQGVSGGYDGLNFATSNVLGDGDSINVVVIYKVKVNTFGLYDKQITVCQRAQTRAWLPPDADEIFDITEDGEKTSIWHETAFVRGKYFVEKLKNAEPNAAVEPGYGVDLYYKSDRVIAEIFSMNVFSASYSRCSVENENGVRDVSAYTADSEYILKQLKSYARDFNLDILKTERIIEMADGSLGNFGRLNEKRLILIVPLEAAQNLSFKECFNGAAEELSEEYGVTLDVRYMEEALV